MRLLCPKRCLCLTHSKLENYKRQWCWSWKQREIIKVEKKNKVKRVKKCDCWTVLKYIKVVVAISYRNGIQEMLTYYQLYHLSFLPEMKVDKDELGNFKQGGRFYQLSTLYIDSYLLSILLIINSLLLLLLIYLCY